MAGDIETPATEIEIAAAIRRCSQIDELTIRRLAFERDRLKVRLEAIEQAILSAASSILDNCGMTAEDPDNLVHRLRRMSSMASFWGVLEAAHITREAVSEIEWLRSRVAEMNDVFGMLRREITLPDHLAKEVDKVMVQEHRE